jgi:hypothetical protein
MAMEVEYEEFASTSSSKHHGWKLEVSRQHKEKREMEALEVGVRGDLICQKKKHSSSCASRSLSSPHAPPHTSRKQ